MKADVKRKTLALIAGAVALTCACSSTAWADGPEVVAGPAAEPECFVPWGGETKFFKYQKKDGPYRIALANGFIANTWRIQMIKTAKAYAEQPDVKAKLKEFKVDLDRRGCRRADRRRQQLHRLRAMTRSSSTHRTQRPSSR